MKLNNVLYNSTIIIIFFHCTQTDRTQIEYSKYMEDRHYIAPTLATIVYQHSIHTRALVTQCNTNKQCLNSWTEEHGNDSSIIISQTASTQQRCSLVPKSL